ncbi:Tektin-4 [Plecturocebus cupreus]
MEVQAQGPLSCLQMLWEVTDQEHNVAALKQAIKDKEAPLCVTQTRLYLPLNQPNMELCRDAGQFRGSLAESYQDLLPTPVEACEFWVSCFREGAHFCPPQPRLTLPNSPRLVSKVEELNMSLAALQEKLLEVEQSLHNLEDTRTSLKEDIASMTNSLFIDYQKCMAHCSRYPTILQLAGYQ